MPRKAVARKSSTRKSAVTKRAAAKTGDPIAGISDAAVAAKTGKTWSQWCKVLDKDGAKELPHKDIAILVSKKHGVGPWWSQMVTVGYEQARGLRKKHETPRGWQASASKTIDVPVQVLYGAWSNARMRARWMRSERLTIRKKNANKSMRITWPDETSVEVNFYAKGEAKSQVAVQHSKLKKQADVVRAKKSWGEALGSLKELLENARAKRR
jgi:hypothetical protein